MATPPQAYEMCSCAHPGSAHDTSGVFICRFAGEFGADNCGCLGFFTMGSSPPDSGNAGILAGPGTPDSSGDPQGGNSNF